MIHITKCHQIPRTPTSIQFIVYSALWIRFLEYNLDNDTCLLQNTRGGPFSYECNSLLYPSLSYSILIISFPSISLSKAHKCIWASLCSFNFIFFYLFYITFWNYTAHIFGNISLEIHFIMHQKYYILRYKLLHKSQIFTE